MRIVIENGHPVIDAAEIAPLLDLDVAGFRQMMGAGHILTRTERGEGDDEGYLRLTLTSPMWRLRLTCTGDGEVLKRSRVRLTPAPTGSPSRSARDSDGSTRGTLE